MEDNSSRVVFILPHPSGDIPVTCVGESPEHGVAISWSIKKGSSYAPEQHKHPHLLTIKEGRGIVKIDGVEHHYEPGSEFWIDCNILHGFIHVDETTIVLEQEH